MTNKEILQADLLDILFERRNKAYGAYALRKNYNFRLQLALGISTSLVFLLSMINFEKAGSGNQSYVAPDLIVRSIDIPKDKPKSPESPQQRKPQQVAQIKNVQIKIVPNNEVRKPEVPTISDLQNALTSTVNKSGILPNSLTSASTVVERENADNKKGNDKPDFRPSASDAQFPGGVDAFRKFLMKYLVTPDELQAGEKKTVLVRFKVDVDGSISSTEIMQSGGEEYDKEVLRALARMPKWIPATQNGAKVATWFTQPVTFIGVE